MFIAITKTMPMHMGSFPTNTTVKLRPVVNAGHAEMVGYFIVMGHVVVPNVVGTHERISDDL